MEVRGDKENNGWLGSVIFLNVFVAIDGYDFERVGEAAVVNVSEFGVQIMHA